MKTVLSTSDHEKVLAQARRLTGRPAVGLLQGEPGFGKSVLLHDVTGRWRPFSLPAAGLVLDVRDEAGAVALARQVIVAAEGTARRAFFSSDPTLLLARAANLLRWRGCGLLCVDNAHLLGAEATRAVLDLVDYLHTRGHTVGVILAGRYLLQAPAAGLVGQSGFLDRHPPVTLDGLCEEETGRLLEGWFAPFGELTRTLERPVDDPLRRRASALLRQIHDRTRGNPRTLEALASDLAFAHAVAGGAPTPDALGKMIAEVLNGSAPSSAVGQPDIRSSNKPLASVGL